MMESASFRAPTSLARDRQPYHEDHPARGTFDEDQAVAERYGTWVEKSMYACKYIAMEQARC